MTPDELKAFLEKVIKTHPEAAKAEIWAGKTHIKYIGFDRRHKPPRIKLE